MGVAVGDAGIVAVALGIGVTDGIGVRVGVGEAVAVGVMVAVAEGVAVGVLLGVVVGVGHGVSVGVVVSVGTKRGVAVPVSGSGVAAPKPTLGMAMVLDSCGLAVAVAGTLPVCAAVISAAWVDIAVGVRPGGAPVVPGTTVAAPNPAFDEIVVWEGCGLAIPVAKVLSIGGSLTAVVCKGI